MKITEFLNAEHVLLVAQLRHLEGLLRHDTPRAELAAAVKTVAAAVEAHHEAEERFLYPAVLEAFGPSFPPLERLLAQERDIQALLLQVAGGVSDRPLVQRFVDLLRSHIDAETRTLFPMVEDKVSTVKLCSMYERRLKDLFERETVRAH